MEYPYDTTTSRKTTLRQDNGKIELPKGQEVTVRDYAGGGRVHVSTCVEGEKEDGHLPVADLEPPPS